eukprot:TRINITY_DN436_c0_g1_i5.p1 TRINITY_DN436_c0_g1~~TRINITY_DN436_c0_g1_i5.p1  ORF type:complete len:111 (+),score=10.93 TRINITY_DN436_c0_g1_i5:111-443(+)
MDELFSGDEKTHAASHALLRNEGMSSEGLKIGPRTPTPGHALESSSESLMVWESLTPREEITSEGTLHLYSFLRVDKSRQSYVSSKLISIMLLNVSPTFSQTRKSKFYTQ